MIDKNRTYRTRDGREVRIYATDGAGVYCVHGAVKTDAGWERSQWINDGTWGGNIPLASDLIEVRPRIKRTVWLNVYAKSVRAYDDRWQANLCVSPRLACVKVEIDVEEGTGL